MSLLCWMFSDLRNLKEIYCKEISFWRMWLRWSSPKSVKLWNLSSSYSKVNNSDHTHLKRDQDAWEKWAPEVLFSNDQGQRLWFSHIWESEEKEPAKKRVFEVLGSNRSMHYLWFHSSSLKKREISAVKNWIFGSFG